MLDVATKKKNPKTKKLPQNTTPQKPLTFYMEAAQKIPTILGKGNPTRQVQQFGFFSTLV